MLAIAVALVVAAAGFVAVRASLSLPRPTGPLPVGTVSFTLERPPEPGERRAGRFAVQVWYPSEPSTDRAPYGTPGPGLKRWLRHQIVRTRAAREAAFAAGERRSPVVVYVAGWGGERTDNTVLAEDLASHGFVVAGVDDLAFDDPSLTRLTGPPDFTSQRAYHATLQLGDERLRYESARASAVLDELTALDLRDPAGRFTHRLDLNRVGILGFSFGGAVALETCRRDSRFKAAMNMDGWLFDAASGYHGGVPYFLVSDNSPGPSPEDLRSPDLVHRYTSQLTFEDEERQRAVLAHGGYMLSLVGADHLSFTDVPFNVTLHQAGNGRVDQHLLARTLRSYTVAFFERSLNGIPSGLLIAGERRQPALTLASWPMRVHQ